MHHVGIPKVGEAPGGMDSAGGGSGVDARTLGPSPSRLPQVSSWGLSFEPRAASMAPWPDVCTPLSGWHETQVGVMVAEKAWPERVVRRGLACAWVHAPGAAAAIEIAAKRFAPMCG